MTVHENITVADAIEAHSTAYAAFQSSDEIGPSLAEEAAALALAERRNMTDGEFLAALHVLLEREVAVWGEAASGEPFALLAILCRSYFEPGDGV
jgi:hypothetical protein